MTYEIDRYKEMTSACINCGACRDNCSFLRKYGCQGDCPLRSAL